MLQMSTDERDPQTYALIGAAMEVHRALGHGFLEAVYQAALAAELSARNIPFKRETPFKIIYRGLPLPVNYRADFLCFDSIVVELKAAAGLAHTDEAQVVNYLKASGNRKALLLNFGAPRLEYKRVIWTLHPPDSSVSSAPSASSAEKDLSAGSAAGC